MTTDSTFTGVSLKAPAIAQLFRREVKPVFLLGAGASFKSGIPLAGQLVESIGRFAYCQTHNRSPDDPRLMRSDWFRWIETQPWFQEDVPLADLYPIAVEQFLCPDANRKAFFHKVLRPSVPPSKGYAALASLLARRLVRTILTTNFDDLIRRAADQNASIHHIDEIVTAGDYTLFDTAPRYPQIVYLHGSVNHYTDRNLVDETRRLDNGLVELLRPLLRDHPLVVIGYRGGEPSVMRHLLIEQAKYCGTYRHGIYWCHLPGHSPLQDSRLLVELQGSIGGNLQFVEIDGFDELLLELDRTSDEAGSDLVNLPPRETRRDSARLAHDLEPSNVAFADLDMPLLRAKLLEYASAMRMSAPDMEPESSLWEALTARGLAEKSTEGWATTRSCQLLFAKGSAKQISAARIIAKVIGSARWVKEVLDKQDDVGAAESEVAEFVTIDGDLWSQLDLASNLLSRANRPFRLKGPVSQNAYPYPPIVLKELITNLLAHRSYSDDRVAELVITPEDIRFSNPGGLVDSLRRELDEESIQHAIDYGARRLKGYRNPVVADFFFSAGAMDKEGSGLPDVVQEANNNLNVIQFGPNEENTAFIATIRARPEALQVEPDTRTARPAQGELRYSANLLQVTEWPPHVTKLGSTAEYKQLIAAERMGTSPFGSHREWLWTFAPIGDSSISALMALSLKEEQHVVETAALLNSPDAVSILPRLLNMALIPYLTSLGMRLKIEPGRIRAYFPSDDGKPREISYRSAFRQSKRTVAKPIVSRSTGNLSYWEHKAVSLRFERFGSEWALSMLPSYVFTLDGDEKAIPSDRIGPLSTRRAARDYNPTVLHDLVFWSRMVSNGQEVAFELPLVRAPDDGGAPSITLNAMIPSFVFQEAIEAGFSDATEEATLDREMDDLQEQIEQAIAEASVEEKEAYEGSDR